MRADLLTEAFGWLLFVWALALLFTLIWIGLCYLGPKRCSRLANFIFRLPADREVSRG